MNFLQPYVYVIFLSFIISLLVYKGTSDKFLYLKIFPPFLLLTIATESFCQYLASVGKNNITIYNFFSVLEFCVYIWLISLIITSKKVKFIAMIVLVLYFVLAVLNILFVQGPKVFHTISYSIGCLLVVAFCIYYFLELFRQPKSDGLVNNPAFWICTGLLFFYCCSFPLYGLMNIWANISPLLIRNFQKIANILNIFLYTLFIIAFLCNRTRKYTLSPS